MVKHLVLIAFSVLSAGVAGVAPAEEGPSLPSAGNDIHDIESLQRGARNFMNYCSGCHSLKYLRYNRLADDLHIPPSELANLMLAAGTKPFDPITTSMPDDAEKWFGKQPPDLTLMARARSPDYIYAYLKGFYVDKTRLWGTNNMILPATAMPAVLSSLQGLQKPVYKNEKDAHGSSSMELVGVEPLSPGAMKPEEYDQFVRDTTNFLDYASEPVKAKRQSLGIFVTLFLLVLFAFAYLLKKEYWKDVH